PCGASGGLPKHGYIMNCGTRPDRADVFHSVVKDAPPEKRAAKLAEIERIFHAALECEPDKLSAYLDSACYGDEDLRRKIESLLSSDQQATDFIETPPSILAAGVVE